MQFSKSLINGLRPVLTVAAAGASVFGLGIAADAQDNLADFNQTDNTSFQFTNTGSASTFTVSNAAFNFNYDGTTYRTLLNITSGVSGPASPDPVSGDNGSGTVTENLSNVTMSFINTDTHSAVHNLLTLTGGTGSLYGLLDDATDAHSNISVAGLFALNGTWSSSAFNVDSNYANSVTMGGITPTTDVSLQSNGHISSFGTNQGGVTGGFQGRPVPEAGTLISLGGMVMSMGCVATRRTISVRRSNRTKPAAS